MVEKEHSSGEVIADGLSCAREVEACTRDVLIVAAALAASIVVVGTCIEYGPTAWRALKWAASRGGESFWLLKWAASRGGESFWLPVVLANSFMMTCSWLVCVHTKARKEFTQVALSVGAAAALFGWLVCWRSALETFETWGELDGFQWTAMLVASMPCLIPLLFALAVSAAALELQQKQS